MRVFSVAIGLGLLLSIWVPSHSYAAGMTREQAGKECRRELGRGGRGDRGGSRMAGIIQSCIRDKMSKRR
jgi:hypothetical protein